MTSIPLLCLLILAAHADPPRDPFQQDQVAGEVGVAIDRQLTRFAEYGFSGSVLVVRDGRPLVVKGYGLADVERGIPNSAATRFEMNSMTKMFTGVAVLQLEGAGRLRVTDPLERHFGPFPPEKRGATIEHLASHTAGLVVAGTALAGESREAFVQGMIRTPRESPPGTKYRYTNAGFSLLGALIERVSGQSYEKYLRERLFQPAGMESAIFRDEVPADDTRFARGYVGTPAGLQPGPPNPYTWGTRGAGGVWSTVADVYRWILAIESGKIIPRRQRAKLFAPHKPPADEAWGWHVDHADGRARIQKGGGSDDFASQMLYYPREKVVIVWASNNLRQRWRRTLNREIANLLFNESALSLPPVVRVEPAALQRRAAHYVAEEGAVDVHAGDNYLYVAANDLKVPANVMFYPNGHDIFTGFDPASGEITRLRFGDGGLTIEVAGGKSVITFPK